MGYSHSYTLQKHADPRFAEITRDVNDIITASEIPMGDANGNPGSQPQLGPELIRLNGIQPQALRNIPLPLAIRLGILQDRIPTLRRHRMRDPHGNETSPAGERRHQLRTGTWMDRNGRPLTGCTAAHSGGHRRNSSSSTSRPQAQTGPGG